MKKQVDENWKRCMDEMKRREWVCGWDENRDYGHMHRNGNVAKQIRHQKKQNVANLSR